MTLQLERIRFLLTPFMGSESLSPAQLVQVSSYLDLLLRWNSKINLSAIRNPRDIVVRHFGEAFFAARHVFPAVPEKAMVLDIGSGAGFPGLPLRLWNEAAMLTLIESHGKKATFLREVVRTLKLKDVKVLNKRVQDVSMKGDLVVIRAVEQFESVLPEVRRLVSSGKRIALLIGSMQLRTVSYRLDDFVWHTPVPVPLSDNRVLLIGDAP